jgi:threonine dehydrogenase-like Zn-dependent dehydrogenase
VRLGVIPQLQKGDVLGHECCGVVESVGPGPQKIKPGQRVVVSFPIACGKCMNCQREFYSQCSETNQNTLTNAMYGNRTAGKSMKTAKCLSNVVLMTERHVWVFSFHWWFCWWPG